MVDIHPKHTFVDENPYLVYDNENDATLDDVSFTLPTASADTLGGVKVGEGLSISDSGVLSASGGGGGNALICNVDIQSETYTLDKTAGEIITAFESGALVIFKLSSGDTYECELPNMYGFVGGSENSYYIATYSYTYYADTLNDYPVYNAGS